MLFENTLYVRRVQRVNKDLLAPRALQVHQDHPVSLVPRVFQVNPGQMVNQENPVTLDRMVPMVKTATQASQEHLV